MSVAEKLLSAYEEMPIIKVDVNRKEVFELACEYNLNGYDASYLWLALDRADALLTLDKQLRQVWERVRKEIPAQS